MKHLIQYTVLRGFISSPYRGSSYQAARPGPVTVPTAAAQQVRAMLNKYCTPLSFKILFEEHRFPCCSKKNRKNLDASSRQPTLWSVIAVKINSNYLDIDLKRCFFYFLQSILNNKSLFDLIIHLGESLNLWMLCVVEGWWYNYTCTYIQISMCVCIYM